MAFECNKLGEMQVNVAIRIPAATTSSRLKLQATPYLTAFNTLVDSCVELRESVLLLWLLHRVGSVLLGWLVLLKLHSLRLL